MLLTAPDIRRLAAGLDLRPTKQWGQNFVIDPNTVRKIVRVADIRPDDVVVEVGPGLGSLTLGLLEVARAVTVVEIDPRLAALLPETVAERAPSLVGKLTVLEQDALTIETLPGDAPTAFVANLPYNVAVPVLLRLLEKLPTLRTGLVMVQAEVADRLAAPPGSKTYGVPSVKAAWYAEVTKAGSIGKNVFWPAPNVDSGLVAFARREPPPGDRLQTFAAIDAAFAQRRKTLRAALAGWAGSAAAAEERLRAAGIDPQARGEVLSVDDFARLAAPVG